jgi:hypothetical protein
MANYENYEQPGNWQLNNLHTAMDWNAAGLPAIRVLGGNTQWGINISAGNVDGVSYVEKFGMNEDVDNAKETIWDGGALYDYLTAPETVAVTSSSGDDNASGTGARTVEVQGLDADFNLVTEILTVGGPAGSQQFIRVFRVIVITSGSIGTNVGAISITSTGTAKTLAKVLVSGGSGLGQTFMALYTVPAGKTAFLTQWTVGAGKQNTDAICFLASRPFGGSWNSKDVITVSATTSFKNYTIPLKFTEKTDIEVRGYSSTNNSLVSSTFNLILMDNQSV